MTTGERMKQRRKELGMSAEYVAEKLGVSPASIYRYEKGDIEKLPGSFLEPLANVLLTTPAYIMGWENDEEKPSTVSALSDEERMLIYCWRQATPEIRENVAFALRSYGMPKPKAEEEDYSTSAGA